jgi:hypothetical protein
MKDNPFPIPVPYKCDVTPLIGGYFYDELLKSIDDSKISIYCVQYQWKWNVHDRHSRVQRLGNSIIRAVNRNVDVNVILNLENPKANITRINQVSCNALVRGGVKAKLLKVSGLVHTKLWVLDTRFVFVGSHNISGRSLGINEEVSVKIDSVDMAKFMKEYFAVLWNIR